MIPLLWTLPTQTGKQKTEFPVEGIGSSGGEEAVSIPLPGPTEGSHIRGEPRQKEGGVMPERSPPGQ